MSIDAHPASSTDAAKPGHLQALASLQGMLTGFVLLIGYVGLEWVSFLHEHKGVPVTPWNPGLGLAFALLVLKGPSYVPVLFGGVVLAELFVLGTALSWPLIVAIAAVVSTSFAATAAVLRQRLRLDVSLTHVRDVLVLLAGGAAAAAISAVLLSVLLSAVGGLTTADLINASVPLLVGDLIGIGVVTPLVLRLFVHWPAVKVLPSLIAEGAMYLLVIGVALWLLLDADSIRSYVLLLCLLLPVLAAALRHGVDGSCMILAATQLGLVVRLVQNSYDAAAFTEFQLVMLVLTVSGLLVGVVVSERQRAHLAARQAEARLNEMQAEAERVARMNLVSGMASALAHEINQPMTAARALARSVQQLLRSREIDQERVDANLVAVVAQIDHAGRVVHRMREFLRRHQPHFSTLDVGTVLDEALVLAKPGADARGIAIQLDLDESLPRISGDRIQLQQVVLNLVHNAMESIAEVRRPDGRIRISARLARHHSVVEISVLDNGAGVPPDLKLFEPLSSSKKDGLGLGLSISASIVEAHGGRIWLQSGSPGSTEVRFSIPMTVGVTS